MIQSLKLNRILITLIICLLLTGCQQQEKMVYRSECLTILRTGRDIRVTSADTGREYNFSLARARRKGSGVVTAKTIIKEDSFTITSTGNTWLIESTEGRAFIRW